MSEIVRIVAVLLVVVLVCVVGVVLVRRTVPRDRLAKHTDVAGYVYAAIGVIYGVILAQVVVAAWDEYREASVVVATEAGAVLNLARLSQGWQEDDRMQVRSALIAYARQVIEVEWPAMHLGDFSPASDPAHVSELWEVVDAAGSHAAQSATYAAALDQLDLIDEARQLRVLIGVNAVPAAMTATLLLGAVVTVGFTFLFAVDDGWAQALMTTSLALLVSVLLLLNFRLETPFQGITALQPTAMELTLAELEPSGT